jgi:molybdenum cofactor cytidylyltransferase
VRISTDKRITGENCALNEGRVAFGVVILAAGASARMGSCKLLLPWGEKTILTHLLGQWRNIGVAQIAPVIDPSNQLLRNALEHAGFSSSNWIENRAPQLGMFGSLQQASRWTTWLSTLTHWIVSLGDQPQVRMSTLRLLVDTARKNPMRICQPSLHGRAAHPIVLPANYFRELARRDIPDLRVYLRTHESFRLRVPVDDPGVSEDLNTPEDYARWKPKPCADLHRFQSIPVCAADYTGPGTVLVDPFSFKTER